MSRSDLSCTQEGTTGRHSQWQARSRRELEAGVMHRTHSKKARATTVRWAGATTKSSSGKDDRIWFHMESATFCSIGKERFSPIVR